MKKILITTITCSALIVTGCGQHTSNTSNNKRVQPYKIGVIAPLSGPGSTYGQDVIHGYQFALDKINSKGGVNGIPLELIIEDGKCSGKDAVSAAQKLINIDGVEVFMGGICSGETMAAGKIAQKNGVIAITPASSSPAISHIGEYMFRFRNSNHEAKAMAEYFGKKGASKIAIVHETTDFAVGFVGAIEEFYTGEIVAKEEFHTDEKDHSILAKKIIALEDQVDHIVLIPQTEATGILFLKALISQGRQDLIATKLMSVVTVLSPSTIEHMGESVIGLKGINHTPLKDMAPEFIEENKELLANYDVKTNEILIILSANTLELIAEGIETVGYDADKLKDYFASFDRKNPRKSRLGEVYFDQYGDAQNIPYSVLEINAEGGFDMIE